MGKFLIQADNTKYSRAVKVYKQLRDGDEYFGPKKIIKDSVFAVLF